MRKKEEIMKKVMNAQYLPKEAIELLADIRDEQVLLNKTLSAVLARLLMPAQQGTPVEGDSISGADAYGTPYKGGKDD